MRKRLLFVINDAGFFVSHRLPVAQAARDNGFEVHVASAAGNAATIIESNGITHHPIDLSRSGINPWRELLAFIEISRLMRRLRPTLVHLVTPKPVLYGSIAARLVGIPAVAAVAGLGHVFAAHDWRTRIVRVLVTIAYRVAFGGSELRVIFQNPSDRDVLARVGAITHEKIIMLRGSGVDLDEYPRLPEPDGIPVVIFAARLLKAKGVYEFVAAAELLRARGVVARFLLVGEADPGNPASVMHDEIVRWHAQGVVEVLGHRRDIAKLFSASNLVVLPSYYGEGLPKVLVEAAACGRAVVTTDMPGCRDAIEPGKTGVLVPPRNAMALAAAVLELLTDHDRRHSMGIAARALAEREYAIERIVAEHLQIYDGLIHG